MILVPQHIADPHDPRPGNMRLACLEVWRDAPSSFRHDLDAPLEAMTQKPIASIVVKRLASRRILHSIDRRKNGAKGRTDQAFRQKTRSAAD